MTTTKTFILLAALSAGLSGMTADAPSDADGAKEAAPATPDSTIAAEPAAQSGTAVPTTESAPPAPAAPMRVGDGESGLRVNFRGVPLELVLNYLSEAAGFIIVLETEVKGKVDVWSNQPLTKDEAVDLLNSVLNKNGYAAIRNGRTLTIVSRDEAKKRDIPVKTGNTPESIPKNDEMITQIIPVRYANAVQMVKDLTALLPTYANLTANESGNALVLTDVQSDIRRMVEIVKALDTSISGISTIRVFPLRYADAKELANVVKEIFPSSTSSNTRTGGAGGGNPMAAFMGRFGGGQGGGGGAGGAAASTGTGTSEARNAASKVTAVADERTNSLVVSAPEEFMATIEQLVKDIDTNAENVTELRVFHLKTADPQEMADMLTNLFPDDTKTDTTRSSIQMGRGGFGGGPGGGAATATATATSTRAKQKGRVLAVPDARTSSVVVSAANDLMPQIAEIIAQLDANQARKQKVFVYSLENADVQTVEQVLRNMFERNSTQSRNSSSSQTTSPLTTRSQSNTQTSGTGTSSSGSNRGTSSGSQF